MSDSEDDTPPRCDMEGLHEPMAQLVALLTVFREARGRNPLDVAGDSASIAAEPFITGSHEDVKMLAIAAIGVLFQVLDDTGRLGTIDAIALSIAADRP